MPTSTQSQIKELEAKIQLLRGSQLSELKAKLHEARLSVAALQAELAKITGTVTVGPSRIRRTRTSPEDVRSGVLKALSLAPTGLSQKEISDAAGLKYQSVAVFLKNNLKDFKFTGALKGKRYFLK